MDMKLLMGKACLDNHHVFVYSRNVEKNIENYRKAYSWVKIFGIKEEERERERKKIVERKTLSRETVISTCS